jgi:hypothetical protein
MIAREDGPGACFERLRAAAFRWPILADGLHCPLCVSFWLALLLPHAPRWLLRWLGVAGAVLVIHQALEGWNEFTTD